MEYTSNNVEYISLGLPCDTHYLHGMLWRGGEGIWQGETEDRRGVCIVA